MRPLRIALMVGLLASTPALLLSCASTPARSAPPERRLVWSDEFEGPKGAAPDPAKWTMQTGAGGWGNEELQTYTADAVALDGAGSLTIRAVIDRTGATPVYTSGRLTSQNLSSFTHGRLEARIRLPAEQGLLPAFWLLGDSIAERGWPRAGEIDVVEVPHSPVVSEHHVHGPAADTGATRASAGSSFTHASALSSGFHIYVVDRSPERIEISVDGQTVLLVTPDDFDGEWVFDEPFHVLFSLAIGGVWPGGPDESTPTDSVMVIDWVRLYE